MRFKTRQRDSSVPTINLVPMLDVLMTVLTFFIITSMVLTTQSSVNVQLPSHSNDSPQQGATPDPVVVELNPQAQILLGKQAVSKEQLFGQMKAYLAQNPKGVVLLKADSKVPYEQVIQLLGEMRDVGGDRVSLAIEG
ncbi:MAG TPA: biopolymer transporter ExbD [Stenomitos sp.]